MDHCSMDVCGQAQPSKQQTGSQLMLCCPLSLSLSAPRYAIVDRFSKPPLMLFKDSGAAASPRSGHKSTRLRQKTAE